MEIIIVDTPAEVAAIAADFIGDHANRGGNIGVATGSTPLATYQELIRRYQAGQVSFRDSSFFALDEYVGLPYEHEQSYHSVIYNEFSNHVDVDPDRVHIPAGMAADLEAACRDYERAIDDAGGIAIQLLGIGTNGHIGFNEPSSSLQSLTRVKTLHPQTVADNARFFDSAEQVPVHVLTQGLGTISRAGQLLLLATGAAKARAIAATVEGPLTAAVPASVLQLHPKATVVIDREAASLLEHADYYEFVYANKPGRG